MIGLGTWALNRKINKGNHAFEIELVAINTKMKIYSNKQLLLQEKQLETVYQLWSKLLKNQDSISSLTSSLKYKFNDFDKLQKMPLLLETAFNLPKGATEIINKSPNPKNTFTHMIILEDARKANDLSKEMYDFFIENLFYTPVELQTLFFNLTNKFKSISHGIYDEILYNSNKINSDTYSLEFKIEKSKFINECLPIINQIESKINTDYNLDSLLKNLK
ncbi:MAG: hypothetical protein CL609_13760 [Anaerolineaceae bacterium]|nr:hypothetical protein [Anaerolineaceae bacterium]